eukprot:CAMPEP_0117454034 /NCGR_PEP_ID=MMETSP0759-20121206/10573_1 /TAXON_ID=63605 /ORGANISM="Percolomonas cosmopolitus, Strain WS" /LENGTH=569 /DNA_ID=CAMNT_0005247169 /DNA_START=103 /DNA_END=1813 /DNA_ORIENTATION=-
MSSHFSPKSYSNPHHDKFNTTSTSIDQDLEALQKAILSHASDSSSEYTDRLKRLENIIIQKDLDFRNEMKKMAEIKQENMDMELELSRARDEVNRLQTRLNDAEWNWKNEVQALKRNHLEEITMVKETKTQETIRTSQELDRASRRVQDQQRSIIENLEADIRQREIDVRERDDLLKRKDYEIDILKKQVNEITLEMEQMHELRKQNKRLNKKVSTLNSQTSSQKDKNEFYESEIQRLKHDREEEIIRLSDVQDVKLSAVKEKYERQIQELQQQLSVMSQKYRNEAKKEHEILIEGYESTLKKYSNQEEEIKEIRQLFDEALEREKKLKKIIFETHMEQEEAMKERESKSIAQMKNQISQLKNDLEDALRLIREKDQRISTFLAESKRDKQQIQQLEEGWKRDRQSQELLAKSQDLLNRSIEKLKTGGSSAERSTGRNSSMLSLSQLDETHRASPRQPQSFASPSRRASGGDSISRAVESLQSENSILRAENEEIRSMVTGLKKQLSRGSNRFSSSDGADSRMHPEREYSTSSQTASKMQETIRKLKKDLQQQNSPAEPKKIEKGNFTM